MNPQKRFEIFRRWREAAPHPKSDLAYGSTFELLVSVILSAQATDKGVNAATRKLYPVANTPAAILALGVEGLTPFIATIGLYKAKAANVIATCRMLIELHGGEVPATREALEALPGVGRKTANVVLNIAFGEPTIAVDTHNFRVANRTGIAPGKTVEAVERGLIKFVPDRFKQHAHHWLILHGRYVCKAQKPDCPNCLISDLCEYKAKTPDPLAHQPALPAGKSTAKGAARTSVVTSATTRAMTRAVASATTSAMTRAARTPCIALKPLRPWPGEPPAPKVLKENALKPASTKAFKPVPPQKTTLFAPPGPALRRSTAKARAPAAKPPAVKAR